MSTPTDQPALPIYLGPQLPRWQPRTVDDVQGAIDDGTLRERHWLDVKAEIGPSDGSKKGLARDLASFANEGGGVLIGVREDKPSSTLTIDPVPLDGLAESVDQIARSRCDPPLYVTCHPLRAPDQGDGLAQGVLLIEVPPSPAAPHMVEGKYYGRGDTTNRRLTDTQVAQLHALRSARQFTAAQLIEAEIARDPVPSEHRELSHIFVVAQPLSSPPDLLTPLIDNEAALRAMVRDVANRVPDSSNIPPSWGTHLQGYEMRAEGGGFRSWGMLGRRFMTELEGAEEGGLLDVEIQDNGRMALFCGRGSVTNARTEEQHVITDAVVILTRCVVTLAGQLGARSGYAGRWMLAVGLTDIGGKYASAAAMSMSISHRYPPFSADSYTQGTEAVTHELLERPGAVTRRLVARLLRGLGSDGPLSDRLMRDTDSED